MSDSPRVFARVLAREIHAGSPPPPSRPPPPPEPPPDPPPSPEETNTAILAIFKHHAARLDKLEAENAELKAELKQRRAAAKGTDGISVLNAEIDGNGHLIFTYSDGHTQNLGRVIGKDAPPTRAPQAMQFERGPDGQIKRAILK